MKFLILITILSIALAIAEGRERENVGRNFGAFRKRHRQGRPFNRIQRVSVNRFVIPPLPVILEKPEQATEPITTPPQPVENILIQNIINNPIEDIGELPINGLVEKLDLVIPTIGEPVYEIPEENLINSLVKNPFEEVIGNSIGELPVNGILGIPDVHEPDFIFDPIIEILESAKETLIESLVQNPFEVVNGNSDGILENPFVQIDPILVPIVGEPDFQVIPIKETLESVEETLSKSPAKNPVEEVHNNFEGEQSLNGIVGEPDIQIDPVFVPIVGEPDFEVNPIKETLESVEETVIKSPAKNPVEEVHGNFEGEQVINGIVGEPDIQIDPVFVPIVGEPDIQIDPVFVPIVGESDFKVNPIKETLESVEDTLFISDIKNPFEEVNGNGILGKPDVQIDPSVVSIVGEPDVQTDSINDAFAPSEETRIESDIKVQTIKDTSYE